MKESLFEPLPPDKGMYIKRSTLRLHMLILILISFLCGGGVVYWGITTGVKEQIPVEIPAIIQEGLMENSATMDSFPKYYGYKQDKLQSSKNDIEAWRAQNSWLFGKRNYIINPNANKPIYDKWDGVSISSDSLHDVVYLNMKIESLREAQLGLQRRFEQWKKEKP